ncbi:MAG: DNA primase [Rikenellaceae bacterium]
MIDKLTIDRIYSTANIIDIVGDFVTLKKKGVNYQACCPFHNEKTPSFVVSPSKGLYKCFGCGKGGNAVTFLMDHENMSYVEALKYVAKKYGIEIQEKELTPEQIKENDNRESMMIVSSYADDYFRDALHNSEQGQAIGLSYFKERGFNNKTIEKFGLGFCPTDGDKFTQTALGKGYKEEFLIATGLTIKKDRGGYYDRFCGRVIFPIHGISGRVTAFGGRTMRTDKNVAKYLNSPESEIYHKSNILYGLFFARTAISKSDSCILVEGYTDVISMHQAGIENVVSSSGTSLTIEQIRLIARFTKNITVIYDGDSAGIKASLRGIDMILREGLNVRVVLLPEGEDPDSFARKHDTASLREEINSRQEDFLGFKMRLLMDEASEDPIKLSALITDMVESIAQIPDSIPRSVYIKECAKVMRVDEQMLISEVARKRLTHTSDKEAVDFVRREQARINQVISQPQAVEKVIAGSSNSELEKELVKYLLKYGDKNFDYKQGREITEINVAETIISDLRANQITFQDPIYQTIYQTYCTLYDAGDVQMHHFINHSDANVCNAVVDILTSDDNYVPSKIWEKHEVIIESEQDRLREAVPRAIILYKCKVIESIIASLNDKLKDENLGDEQMSEIMYQIALLNKERILISKKLSRLII